MVIKDEAEKKAPPRLPTTLHGMTPNILPGILKDIAEIAGMQAAMDLCAAARGTSIYFPRDQIDDDCRLVKAVGFEAALLLCAALGGESFAIPTARPVLRAYRARTLRSAGYSMGQIAAILNMDRSTVQRLAPASACPSRVIAPSVVQAILNDAPQRFAGMKPNGVSKGGHGRPLGKAV